MLESQNLPKHIAIIPDGNRRWARERGYSSLEGHTKGFEAANNLIKYARNLGVHTLTLWAFSTENWNRDKQEVGYLMKLFENNIESNLKEAKNSNARIIHLGRKDRIPKSLRVKIQNAEEQTFSNTKHVLNIALDYGGQDEILRAVEKFSKDLINSKVTLEKGLSIKGKYNDKYPLYFFNKYLDTKEQPYPYPDLVIRTSGEQRLSGFMPWQICYSEIIFSKKYMPDFSPKDLEEAIANFSARERRFGGNAVKVTPSVVNTNPA